MTVQRNDAWVKAATPDQIVAAQERGELQSLLQGASDIPDSFDDSRIVQRDAQWFETASIEERARALDAGELVELLGGTVNELGNAVGRG